MIGIFDKYPLIKGLQDVKRYDALEERIRDLQGKLDVREITTSRFGRSIYALTAGNPETEHTILLTAANHGREDAPPLSLVEICRQLAESNDAVGRLLEKVRIIILPCLDPDGFDCRGVKCVDPVGNTEIREMYAADTWADVNSVWCREDQFLPPETRELKGFFLEVSPSIAIDLHETLPYGPTQMPQLPRRFGLSLNNYGITLIEFIPEESKALGESIGAGIVSNLKASYYIPRRISRLGRFIRKTIFPLPQTVTKSEGREASGPLLTEFRKGRMVLSDWLSLTLNIPAFSSESFFSPLEYRVGANIAAVEGAIKSFAEYNKLTLPAERPLKKVAQDVIRRDGNFYLACVRIARGELGEYRLFARQPNRFFNKETVVAWNAEKTLYLKRKFPNKIKVTRGVAQGSR